jgi:antitoxin component of MazEF toxin-antitoxin module
MKGRKKLTRIEQGVALVLDEALLAQLGLDESSEVELLVRDGTLVVVPETERDRRLREVLDEMDEQHGNVFRRLADS